MIGILIAIFIGGLSGWIASMIMDSNGSFIKNIIIGICGGVLGDIILGIFDISMGGYFGNIIISILGACLLIFLINKFLK